MKSIEEAQSIIAEQAPKTKTETIPFSQAYNRVLGEDVLADRDYPPFNRAMMDGYAIRSSDWNDEKIREYKVLEEVHAGMVARAKIGKGECIKIMTGAATPTEADAIIQVELAERDGEKVVFANDVEVKPWRNLAWQGEDTKKGQVLAKKGQLCDAALLSVLATTGKTEVKVARQLTVSVISTGTEILPPATKVLPHQIRDSNSYALLGLLKKYNIDPDHKLLVPDDKSQLKSAMKKGLQSDVLILSGGVSMGDADFVPEVLGSLGVKTLFHKVQIKPGKPFWFGRIPDGCVVFGLPGNPMSCQVGFKVFVETYLRKALGLPKTASLYFPFLGTHQKRSKFREYFPCHLTNLEGKTFLKANTYNTSGDIAAMIGSDGLGIHPAENKKIESNTHIEFLPW